MLGARPWLTAPAALWRRPALALVAGLGGLLVGLVAATPPLFADTVGAGAVQRQWDRACPADVEAHLEDDALRGLTSQEATAIDKAAHTVAAFGPVDWVAESRATTFRHGDRHTVGGFLTRANAVDHLDVITSTDHGEVWISDTAATALGVAAGDSLVLDSSADGPDSAVVRGVFRDMTKAPLDDYWCGASKQLRAGTVFTDAVPPPKAIIDPRATGFADRLRGAGDLFVTRINFPFATAPRTIPDARSGQVSIGELTSAIGAGLPDGALFTENLDRLTTRAAAVKHAVAGAVRPLTILALGAALAVVAALGSMWTRVKRNDVIALSSMGIGPGWVGVKAALECLVWVVAGAVSGAALARLSLSTYAPADDVEGHTFLFAVGVAAAMAAGAVVLIGVTAGVAARTVLRAVPRRVLPVRWFPIEAVLGVLAWASFRSFRHGSLVQLRGRDSVVGNAALTFPLLCFATMAVVLARLWVLGMRRTTSRLRFVAPGLALRRLQHSRRFGAAIVALGALAVSVAVYGAGLVASLDYTGHAKSRVYVGSDVRADVRLPLQSELEGMTRTAFVRDADFAGTPVEVLAIDPATFAKAAFWDDSFADRSLHSLLGTLASSPAVAVTVGEVPAAGTVTNRRGKGSFRVDSVVPVGSFPGMRNNKPLVVVTLATLAGSGMNGQNQVLAHGDRERVLASLAAAGTEPFLAISADNVIDVSELLFASWTFVFVRALGVFVGVLVVVALVAQLISRQRQQALGFGILRRLGVTSARHRLALMVEMAALAVVMCACGVTTSLAVSRLVVPRLDPMKVIPPAPLVVVPVTAVVVLLTVIAFTVASGSAVAQAIGARTNMAGALRDD